MRTTLTLTYRDSLCSLFTNATRLCLQLVATFVMERALALFLAITCATAVCQYGGD